MMENLSKQTLEYFWKLSINDLAAIISSKQLPDEQKETVKSVLHEMVYSGYPREFFINKYKLSDYDFEVIFYNAFEKSNDKYVPDKGRFSAFFNTVFNSTCLDFINRKYNRHITLIERYSNISSSTRNKEVNTVIKEQTFERNDKTFREIFIEYCTLNSGKKPHMILLFVYFELFNIPVKNRYKTFLLKHQSIKLKELFNEVIGVVLTNSQLKGCTEIILSALQKVDVKYRDDLNRLFREIQRHDTDIRNLVHEIVFDQGQNSPLNVKDLTLTTDNIPVDVEETTYNSEVSQKKKDFLIVYILILDLIKKYKGISGEFSYNSFVVKDYCEYIHKDLDKRFDALYTEPEYSFMNNYFKDFVCEDLPYISFIKNENNTESDKQFLNNDIEISSVEIEDAVGRISNWHNQVKKAARELFLKKYFYYENVIA